MTYLNMEKSLSLLSGCPHHCVMVCVAFCIALLHVVPVVANEDITTCKYSINRNKYFINIKEKEQDTGPL